MTAVELTALVPRAVEGRVAFAHVIHHAAKERRQHFTFVAIGRGVELFAIVVGVIVTQFKDPGHARQHVGRQRVFTADGDKHRQAKTGRFDGFQNAVSGVRHRQHHGGNVGEVGAAHIAVFTAAREAGSNGRANRNLG